MGLKRCKRVKSEAVAESAVLPLEFVVGLRFVAVGSGKVIWTIIEHTKTRGVPQVIIKNEVNGMLHTVDLRTFPKMVAEVL